MGTHLSAINAKPTLAPPRIVVHGKGGTGKTTFGASWPKAIIMPLEEGLGILKVAHFDRPTSYVDVMNALAELYNEEHDFKTLVIDTIDKLEPMIWDHTCTENSTEKKTLRTIEDFGYGKGFVYAEPYWIEFFKRLDLLRRKGMTIIVLSHDEIRTINDPRIGPYDSVGPKLHKRANALLFEWADLVGYLDIEKAQLEKEGARGKSLDTAQLLGTRVLHLEEGGFEAKNRFGLPKAIEIPVENGYKPLREAILKAFGVTDKPKATKKAAAAETPQEGE